MFAGLLSIFVPHLLSAIVLFPIISYVTRKASLLVQSFLSPLSDIPGPLTARLSRTFKLWKIFKGSFEDTAMELHRKYGALFRIAPDTYIVDDPTAARTIYGPGSHFTKSLWYSAMAEGDQVDLFSVRSEILHREIRRNLGRAFTPRLLLDLEPFVDDCTTILLEKLRSFGSSAIVDIDQWMKCYVFDVSGEMAVRNLRSHVFDRE
ncbi:MAG: hypothetical protein Q9227_007938 [Pyrenula ochraceoflavens]